MYVGITGLFALLGHVFLYDVCFLTKGAFSFFYVLIKEEDIYSVVSVLMAKQAIIMHGAFKEIYQNKTVKSK